MSTAAIIVGIAVVAIIALAALVVIRDSRNGGHCASCRGCSMGACKKEACENCNSEEEKKE